MSESKNSRIKHAQIDWSDQYEPFSSLFDDHYFNTDQGIKEAEYVFLQGNQLVERWLTWENESFNIAETGFGTGLNFLVTCLSFEKFRQQYPDKPLKKIFFTSFEKYPLDKNDLTIALRKWPDLTRYVPILLAQYPLALRGCHRLHFSDIYLDLWFGDVHETLPTLYLYPDGLFDCWYLDGFSPSKNPDMWNDNLFKLVSQSAKQQSTIATFSAASRVRQGLESVGFNINKRKGYAKKREMLIGKLEKKIAIPNYTQHYRTVKMTNSKNVAIIGGGISSACLSLALVNRGYHVTLYCKKNQLGSGASGNQQGALYPLLNAQHNPLSEFFANSFLYARHYIEEVNQSHPFDFDFSGLLQLYYDASAAKKLDKILEAQLPETLVQPLTEKQTDAMAHLNINQKSLFYSLGGWLSPKQMVNALFQKAKETGQLTFKLNHTLHNFESDNAGWICHFDNKSIKHDLLILTTAMNTLDFKSCEALPLSSARGQVTHIKSNAELSKLAVTVCHEGYLTPMNNNFHCMGATFKRHSLDESFSQQEQKDNKSKLEKCIKDKNWIREIETDHQQAHVGIRCTTRDHFPYMGALPDYQQTKINYRDAAKKLPIESAPFHDNLFILTGLGSRGLNTAPLLAEALASQINQEPIPLSLPILNALQCNRQWINYLKKGKVLKF